MAKRKKKKEPADEGWAAHFAIQGNKKVVKAILKKVEQEKEKGSIIDTWSVDGPAETLKIKEVIEKRKANFQLEHKQEEPVMNEEVKAEEAKESENG